MDEETLKLYKQAGVKMPSVEPHGTEEDIKSKLKQLLPYKWHLEGNKLYGQTDMGTLVQYIPTDYILVGEDNGLPKLVKVEPQ